MEASFGLSDAKVLRVNVEAASFGQQSLSALILDEVECEVSSLKRVRVLVVVCVTVPGLLFIISLSLSRSFNWRSQFT